MTIIQFISESRRLALLTRLALVSLAMALAEMLSACGGSANITAATANGPQQYMTPVIYGGSGAEASPLSTFSIDHTAATPGFAQQTYAFNNAQSGPKVIYSGSLVSSGLARGLEELELTYASGTSYNSPQAGSGWAVELADQSGALAQLTPESFMPLVPAVTCPSGKSAQSYLFVTLPALLLTAGTGTTGSNSYVWNPKVETAYGSADISASGSTVTLANIRQNILPSVGGGTPANAPSSSVTGVCSSTVYGNTVAIPANPTITIDPTGTQPVSPQAMLGIGPSGLLVENNGSTGSSFSYENVLGAGTGAIGLPKPSSTVDVKAITNAQYLGFFFGSGSMQIRSSGSAQITNGFSYAASFGFPSTPSGCPTSSGTLTAPLYGGDFPGNDPSAASVQAQGGFGNCDLLIDLGVQDSSTNGLFPNAIVYVGPGFASNTTGKNYSFPAVAIAGQLNGKYAIFVIGEDTSGSPNQAWGIYLLQSN